MVPEGWEHAKIGALANVKSGGTPDRKNALFWNGDIPWVTTAEINYSLITDTKEKITFHGLASSSASLFPKGTLLIAMYGQGKTRGKIAILGIDAATNQACAAVFFKDGYSTDFYYHVLTSHYEKIRGLANSGGQKNLSARIVKEIPVPVPPLPEQRKIAKILQTWDRAIATTEKLIEASKQQKKALMQQLLTGKRRFGGFERAWSTFKLHELLDYSQPTKYIVRSTNYRNEFTVPVLTAGKTFVLGYTNENFGVYEGNLPCIIFDDFTTASRFVDFPFKVKSSAIKILTPRGDFPVEYIFESMQLLDFVVGGHKRHWISTFSKLEIQMPERNECEKISSVLRAATLEIEALLEKLEAIKKEKSALMQQLLTGKRRVKVIA